MTAKNPTKVSQLLNDAFNLIDKPSRWIKNRSHSRRYLGDGMYGDCFCATGALRAAAHKGAYSDQTLRRAYKALAAALPKKYQESKINTLPENQIVAYNDAPKTRHHLITRVFNTAIKEST